jgi:hypothetical protein
MMVSELRHLGKASERLVSGIHYQCSLFTSHILPLSDPSRINYNSTNLVN